MRPACTGKRRSGAPCPRVARKGEATCTVCAKRAAKAAALDALARDPAAPPACGDCGACGLCDAVLAYEDAAAERHAAESTASAVSPGANQLVADGPEGAVDAAAPLSQRAPIPPETPPCVEVGRGDTERSAPAAGAALVLAERGVSLYECDWRALAEVARAAGGVDALIVDAPYSERTHAGHDGGAAQANGPDDRWTRSNGRVEAKRQRRDLDYSAWTAADVDAFVDVWHPLVRGWIVSLTDDGLFGHWRTALARVGRQTFQDVPCVVRGMSVRLVGDGPSSWAVHAAVARPRTKAMAQWGTLDGAYEGPSERQSVVGGKPIWLMRALVRDYSRPGDLIADACCGAGTLGVAAIAEGRHALLGDRDAAHVEIARKRLRSCPGEQRRLTLDVDAKPMTQASLLETGT